MVGRAGLVTGNEGLPPDTFYPDLLIRVRFDHALILPDFAALVWNSAGVHGRLIAKAKSTNGTWKVNGKDIAQHELPLPPVSEQRLILAQRGPLADALARVERTVDTAADARAAMLSRVWGERHVQ